MADQSQVISLNARYPDMSAAEIAERLGCDSAYVRATGKRKCLVFGPGCASSRTAAELRARARKHIDRADELISEAHRLEYANDVARGRVSEGANG